MLNKVILIGRLTKDAELRYISSGKPVAKFSLAVERPFSNQGGKKEVDFIPVSIWNKIAEAVAKYTSKGSLVAVEGRIQISNFEGKDGQTKRNTEVIAETVKFLDNKKNGNNNDYCDGFEGSFEI